MTDRPTPEQIADPLEDARIGSPWARGRLQLLADLDAAGFDIIERNRRMASDFQVEATDE